MAAYALVQTNIKYLVTPVATLRDDLQPGEVGIEFHVGDRLISYYRTTREKYAELIASNRFDKEAFIGMLVSSHGEGTRGFVLHIAEGEDIEAVGEENGPLVIGLIERDVARFPDELAREGADLVANVLYGKDVMNPDEEAIERLLEEIQ